MLLGQVEERFTSSPVAVLMGTQRRDLGTGRHRVQIAHFFRGQNGSWRSLEVGLVVGSRLHRIRRRCGSLVLSEGSESKPWQKVAIPPWAAERNRPRMLEAAAYAT